MEGVLGGAAVRGRVGERADGPEQLDDRARPAVRHDQRQGVLVLRPYVDEVDLDAVDDGRVLRQGVQLRLARAPVVVGRPVAGQLLDRRQLHALGAIGDQLSGGPARGRDPAPHVVDYFFRRVEPKGADLVVVRHVLHLPGRVDRHRAPASWHAPSLAADPQPAHRNANSRLGPARGLQEKDPGARFRSSRGHLCTWWRVEDSNLCSFRDGFTVRSHWPLGQPARAPHRVATRRRKQG